MEKPSNHNHGAIYKFRLLAKDNKPLKIRRMLADDNSGILCIGKTTNMERRLKQFRSGVYNCKGHSEGNLFYLVKKYCKNFDYKPELIQYRFKAYAGADLELKEEKCIKRYIKSFGEVPPFNSAIPNRYGSW